MGLEEQIWEYIDGTCTAEERKEIETKIVEDPSYKKVYEERITIHHLMEATDLEEPSMSFSRKVMDQVNLEFAPVTLKTKVDERIIFSIAGFFIVSLLSIVVYAVFNTSFDSVKAIDFKMPLVTLNNITNISSSTMKVGVQAFFFIDIVLGLIYLDRLLRKKLGA